MKITVDRKYKKELYTISNLYVDGTWISNVIEDTDRGLKQTDSVASIKAKKVYAKTAIPSGTYKVTLDFTSPKFSKKEYYKKFCNGKVPRLCNVPGFDGILIHCLTPDMEILTENGWQDMQSYYENPAANCYSYNVEKDCIELVPVEDFIVQDYDGKLYCNEGRRINYSVTDKHRMFVGNKNRKGELHYSFRTADNLLTENTFLTSSYNAGEEIDNNLLTFYRLIMAVQADGYIINWSNKSSQVRFHFKKERKINRVKKLITDLGYSYRDHIDCEGKTHISLCSELSNLIAEIMNSDRKLTNNKELPLEILKLDSSYLKELLMEYLFWDGRYENYLKNNNSMSISSTNRNTLNILQAMATLCGMRSYIKKDHGVNIYVLLLYNTQDKIQPEPSTYTTKNYEGQVWCLSNVNTTLVVRQNYRTMIIGNCGVNQNSSAGCLIVGYNTARGKVTNSQEAFEKLYKKLLEDKNNLTIEIKE